jgi:hypothetical protein
MDATQRFAKTPLRKKMLQYYVPAAFCAFLGLMVITMQILFNQSTVWGPAFFCFLPMCFFFLGGIFHSMQSQIDALKKEI